MKKVEIVCRYSENEEYEFIHEKPKRERMLSVQVDENNNLILKESTLGSVSCMVRQRVFHQKFWIQYEIINEE